MKLYKNKDFRSDKGVTAVEYGLLSALIAIVIMGSLSLSGKRVKETFCSVGLSLASGYGCVPGNITDAALKPVSVAALGGAGYWFSDVESFLNQLNEKDAITGIYGFYSGSANGSNNSSGNDITADNPESFEPLRTLADFDDYIDNNEKGTWDYWSVSSGFSSDQVMEVSTESGKAYTIHYSLQYPVHMVPYAVDNNTGEKLDLE